MCKAPKINNPAPPPPPPPVLDQMAPMKRINDTAANQRSGSKRYRAGGSGLAIGGMNNAKTGVGGVGD